MNGHCAEIADQIGALFTCSEHGDFVRIRTPFLYPDGDVLDLFISQNNGVVRLSDLGESLRWLRMQTATLKRTAKQRQLISDVCNTHHVELFQGMLTSRVAVGETLASAVLRLSEACIRVSDLWFTFRSRAVQSIPDEVAEFLTERQIRFAQNDKQIGRSGRIWSIDFHTMTPTRSAFVQVLSTGSRDSAHRISESVVASFHDLSHVRLQNINLSFISLFDDTMDVWGPEDVKLVESISNVARWSRPDQFEEMLKAA